MQNEELRARRYQEAIERLLEVNVEGMFVGIHRVNSLLEKHKLENPLTANTIFQLGVTLGSIQLLQAMAPEKGQPA